MLLKWRNGLTDLDVLNKVLDHVSKIPVDSFMKYYCDHTSFKFISCQVPLVSNSPMTEIVLRGLVRELKKFKSSI